MMVAIRSLALCPLPRRQTSPHAHIGTHLAARHWAGDISQSFNGSGSLPSSCVYLPSLCPVYPWHISGRVNEGGGGR